MIRRYGKALRGMLMLADGSLAVIAGLIAYKALAHPNLPMDTFLEVFWSRGVLYALMWVSLLYVNGAYRLRAHWGLTGEARAVVRATFWLALLGLAALFFFGADAEPSGYVLLLFPAQGLAAIGLRAALRAVFMEVRRRGHNVRNLIIVGTGPQATAFAALVRDQSVLGLQVTGYLGDQAPTGQPAALYRGRISELPRILREEVVDEIALCVQPTQVEWRIAEEAAQLAHMEGKLVRMPLAVPNLATADRFLEDLEGTTVLSYASGPDELASHALKRAFDLAVASVAIVLLAPVMGTIAVLLRWRQGPGVIFRQTRVGLHGRPFRIYKFRTMVLDAEERYEEVSGNGHTRGAAFKMVGDPRITRLGRWLRRFSLDEMPQFFNVLKGEMSVVGPRPAPPREVEGYDLWHRRRLSVKPGITGLWQITSRLDRDFDDRATLDLMYIDRWSLWLDVAIMFRTLPALLRRPGH